MKSNRLKLNCGKTECIGIITAQRQRTFVASTVTVGGVSVCPSSGACNRSMFWQQITFEAAYLQRYQKLLLSAAATTCCLPCTDVRRPENSAPGIHHMPVGLLQLIASGTTGLWCQSSTICPECSWPSLWWCIQIWFCWACICVTNSIGYQSCKELNSGSGFLYIKLSMTLHPPTCRISLFQSQAFLLWVEINLQSVGNLSFIATKNITYHRRSFAVAGPTLWNSLPLEIRSFSSCQWFVPDSFI